MTFKDLGLSNSILNAVEKEGYEAPTLIQQKAIPIILDKKDVLGCAQTGTGKTAAFALPIIDNLLKEDIDYNKRKEIKVLVLTPTRELAVQVRDNFRKYTAGTKIKSSVIFGGVNQRSQVEVLRKGLEIVVATPGRLLDLINQRHVKLGSVTTLVLDEADMMLDMGFIIDVNKIVKHMPEKRQTLLFSATMPKEIQKLADTLLKDPTTIRVHSESPTVEKINQSLYYIDRGNKTKLLIDPLKKDDIKSALVFTRTKNGANRLSEQLINSGIKCDVIHGNKSQSARTYALNNFKNGRSKVLIATDIAARGIDISEISHVINYEIPEKAETYIHRIGRTARAGFDGVAISMATLDEKNSIIDIQNLIKQTIPVITDHEYPMQQVNLTPKVRSNYKGRSSSNKKGFQQGSNFGSQNKSFNKGFSGNRSRDSRKNFSKNFTSTNRGK